MTSASFLSGFLTAFILFGDPDYLSWIAKKAIRLNKKIYISLKAREDDDEDMFDEHEAPENEPQQARVKTDSPDYIN